VFHTAAVCRQFHRSVHIRGKIFSLKSTRKRLALPAPAWELKRSHRPPGCEKGERETECAKGKGEKEKGWKRMEEKERGGDERRAIKG